MEPIDYLGFLRRWWILILGCAALGFLAGTVTLQIQRRSVGAVTYSAKASMILNYITPAGVAYNPTWSPRSELAFLSQQVYDPSFRHAVAQANRIKWQDVGSITIYVDPTLPLISVNALGRTTEISKLAQGLAQGLGDIEGQRVHHQEASLRKQFRAKVAQTQSAWIDALTTYEEASLQRTGSQAVLARLQALASVRQQDYVTASSQYDAVGVNPVPAATVKVDPKQVVPPQHGSTTKTVIPAALLGLLLGIGLAAALDYLGFMGSALRLTSAVRDDSTPTPARPIAPEFPHVVPEGEGTASGIKRRSSSPVR